MIIKKTAGDKAFDVINYAFLTLLAFICIYPLWHVICGSFSDAVALNKHSGAILWPLGFSLGGYKNVFSNPNIGQGFLNTLFYVGIGTLIRMVLTVIGAYVLSEHRFMLRKPLTLMIVFTMYFTGGMIPDYLLVNACKLTNTRWALIIPLAITTWNMIILKTAFQAVPSALVESARLDGASELRTLIQIILPVTKASLAVVTMYYAVNEWNSWFKAAIYLPARNDLHPLQLVMRDILIVDSASAGTSLAESSGVANMHLSDYDRVDEKHWLPGNGVINWQELFSLLKSADYKGNYLVEIREYSAVPSQIAAPDTVMERMKAILPA